MFKDIMVHLDGSAEDESRLSFAEGLAQPFEGHITGVFTNLLPDSAWLGATDASGTVVQVLIEMEDRARTEGDRIFAQLAERLPRLAAVTELRRLEAGVYQIEQDVTALVRSSDVFIMTRPLGPETNGRWADMLEAVLFDSGRAVIAVPPGYTKTGPIRKLLLAWQDSREAARAVSEALPLIHKADMTRIVIIEDEKKRMAAHEAPAGDIARHLHRHGAAVEIMPVDEPGRPVSERILKAAHEWAPDLIVMGGYGHSRFREWILGGTTRDMLMHSDIPLLIAH